MTIELIGRSIVDVGKPLRQFFVGIGIAIAMVPALATCGSVPLRLDNLERVAAISYPTGATTALKYDGGSSPSAAAKGELTKMTDESGVVTYGYDALGRMTTKTVVTNSKTFVVTYTWGNTGSAMDKVTAVTYPSGSWAN